jgi:hypothetical protein
MVITEERLLVEQQQELDDDPVPPVALEDRARDEAGHCWDGKICDHPDHGDVSADYGTIHFMR